MAERTYRYPVAVIREEISYAACLVVNLLAGLAAARAQRMRLHEGRVHPAVLGFLPPPFQRPASHISTR
jgi:hypothetical protein